MTELIVELEGLLQEAEQRAENNFIALVECLKASLPEAFWQFIPKSRSATDMGGLFTGSVVQYSLTLFQNMPDYKEIDASFKVNASGEWEADGFRYYMGFLSPPARINTLPDAVLLSRMLVKNKDTQLLSQETPEDQKRVM